MSFTSTGTDDLCILYKILKKRLNHVIAMQLNFT